MAARGERHTFGTLLSRTIIFDAIETSTVATIGSQQAMAGPIAAMAVFGTHVKNNKDL